MLSKQLLHNSASHPLLLRNRSLECRAHAESADSRVCEDLAVFPLMMVLKVEVLDGADDGFINVRVTGRSSQRW